MLKLSRYFVVSALFFLTLLIFLTFNPDSYDVGPADAVGGIVLRNPAQAQAPAAGIAVVADSAYSGAADSIAMTMSLLKQGVTLCGSVNDAGSPRVIIVAMSALSHEDVRRLKAYLADGVGVIFAALPSNIETVADLLGITACEPGYAVEGFDIYEGVLLDGMFRADGLTLECLKISLNGRCKVFANGHNPNRDKTAKVISPDDENPLIWRTYYDGGVIFAVNAPFLVEESGAGILTGLVALVFGDFLYPVAGTKSVALNNFPYTGGGQIAGRSYLAYTRDIVWPGLLSLARNTNITFTCLANGGLADDSDAYDLFAYMHRELRKIQGELGYSSASQQSVTETDMAYLDVRFPTVNTRTIRLAAAHADDLSTETDMAPHWATAVITGADTASAFGMFEWINDSAVALPVSSTGLGSEKDAYAIINAASAFGLVIHETDIAPLYRGEISWNEYSISLSRFFSGTIKGLDWLRSVPVGSAAEALKDCLNAALDVTVGWDSVAATVTGNTGVLTFILRTDKTVDGQVNCEVSEIGEGAYLVRSAGPAFTVYLKPRGNEKR